MNFCKQYLKFINYSLIGLAFSFSSFYIFSNIFHYLEIRKEYVVDFRNYALVNTVDNSLKKVQNNLNKITTNSDIKENIDNCVSSFNNDVFLKLKEKESISVVDIYNLTDAYENEIVSKCFNGYLSFLRNDKFINNSTLISQKKIMNSIINDIINDTFFIKKDLLDNSNYYFSMNYDNDNLKDKLDQILDSYNKASDFLLYISEWYSKEVN